MLASLTLVRSRLFSRFLDTSFFVAQSVTGPAQLLLRALPGNTIAARDSNQLQRSKH